MPVSESEFKEYILEFRSTAAGSQFENDRSIGFIDDKLSYFELKASSIGEQGWPYEDKHPVYLKWQGFLDEFKKNSTKSL